MSQVDERSEQPPAEALPDYPLLDYKNNQGAAAGTKKGLSAGGLTTNSTLSTANTVNFTSLTHPHHPIPNLYRP